MLTLCLLTLCHQVVETLRVDDGLATGFAANADTSFREAVRLEVPDSAKLLGLLFYPADPENTSPQLNYMVWAPDDSGKPDSVICSGTLTNPVPDQWNYIDITDQNIFIKQSHVFVGWRTGPELFYNWYDSFLNGYNWWFDGVLWRTDSSFPGDFMIRAVAEVYYAVNESQDKLIPGLVAFPNPSSGPVQLKISLKSPGLVAVACYDRAGRSMFTIEQNLSPGVHIINISPGLAPGTYFIQAKGPGFSTSSKLLIR